MLRGVAHNREDDHLRVSIGGVSVGVSPWGVRGCPAAADTDASGSQPRVPGAPREPREKGCPGKRDGAPR